MEDPIKQYKYRYVVIASYILAALVNSIPSSAFSSINSIVQKTFQLSIIEVSLNSLLFTIAHTLFSFPCNWLLNRKGIRVSFFVSAGLVITGVWLRTFLHVGEPFICLLGSLLSGIGGVFILNTPSRIALNWFGSNHVPLVISVGMLTNLVSMAISLSVPAVFISASSSPEEIIAFFRMEAIVITVPFILLVIFFREKPPHPPSKAAKAMNEVKKGSYFLIIKELFSNKNYLKLCATMALNYGVSIGYFATLDQMLVGIGYENSGKVISICASSGTIFGVVATFTYSYVLKKTKQFKKVVVASTLGVFVGLLIWVIGFLQQVNVWWQLALLSSLFCVNYFSIPSIYVLFSTEIAFPVDQASAAGYLMAISQTIGFVVGIIYASLLDGTKQTARMLFFITAGSLFLSFILSLSIKEDLRKTRFEESKQELLTSKDSMDGDGEGRQTLLSDN